MPFVPGLESFVKIAIPLKHPEDTYTFVHTPEYPGEMIIQIVSSCATAPTIKPKPLPDLTTPKPKPKPEEVKKPEENKAEGSKMMHIMGSPLLSPTVHNNTLNNSNKRPREIDPNDDSPTEPESESDEFGSALTKKPSGPSPAKKVVKYEKPVPTRSWCTKY